MKARLPKGIGGGSQNVQAMMQQAQQMQQKMEEKQEQIHQQEFQHASGGGAVQVTMNGAKQLIALEIKPEVVDPEDIEMLQDLIMSAVNACSGHIEEVTASEMDQITGGVNIPGL